MNPDLTPSTSNVVAAAVQWLQGTLLGSIATTIAVIAVACVGILLVSGRLDVRRAAQVIFGCFTIFGASAIASGLVNVMTGSGQTSPGGFAAPAPIPANAVVIPRAQPAVPYDPYAGAAMPARR
jgi:type IV secretion system protein VirB2